MSSVEYWRNDGLGVEAMRARFRRHVYAPHSHETYSFGVTDAGAQGFRCRGGTHTSSAGMVMAFNPDEVHDGHAAADLGYHYRIVHIHPRVVADVLTDAADGRAAAMPLFARPVLPDPMAAHAINRLYAAVGAASPLVVDERLTAVITALTRSGATRAPLVRTLDDTSQRKAAFRARDLLHQSYLEPIPVEALAEAAGCSRFALYRAFRDVFGLAPSDYQRQLRLRHARSLLATGTTPADAAAASGFADQAHLARWFHRSYGLTPGTFIRAAESALPSENAP
ncbi:AraC family transcriptional regulator [Actinomadura barringtoniae]|uniref:AraC family transcriptional regulator n=1 Tax=Actinomadura barringtoniae TaxID=1427535 RepID=A0A939TB23_9ACTN|nr:AraC family transcriptional regulator [Actinomadura barringtoniae]MBO2453097.1 AraC family transcriptional regulator [Actinomadura barringtoniae]